MPEHQNHPIIGADYVHLETGEVREVVSCDGVSVEYYTYDIFHKGTKRSSLLRSFMKWSELAEMRNG